jgi:hypothetical protein
MIQSFIHEVHDPLPGASAHEVLKALKLSFVFFVSFVDSGLKQDSGEKCNF